MVTRRIPLEDFFRKPERVMVRLSPDGSHLAYMAPFQRRLNLFVRDLTTGSEQRITGATERDIAGYLWANSKRLIYLKDDAGDENFHLHSVDRNGDHPLDLTPYPGVQCSLVDDLEEVDDQILFQMNKRNAEIFDVYRLDVNTGEMTMIAENEGNIQRWITDHDGRLLLATTTDGTSTSILHRQTEESDWRTVATYDYKEAATPLFFTFDNAGLYVSSNVGRDKSAIFFYDLATGKEGELLFEHPDVDVSQLLSSRKRRKVTGVGYETDQAEYEFFDDERRRLQEFIDGELPGYENRLVSHNREEDRYVVYSGSDRTRGGYYFLDATAMTLEKLFDLSPWLQEEEMSAMQPIRYESRDGLTIHGYLSLPVGAEAANLPLVVHPHGGPWHRDSWGFDPEVQFLTNRGFAVLQMNFRASTGYGRSFMEAGFGQWGLAMQDDITDAVRWAVNRNLADPRRVAIYGGSYGGYATLAGVTSTPELYACAISYVGVSNLFTWFEAIPPYWKPYLEMMYEMVGHPEQDEERFRATSPYFNADKIRVPLLVAQGANDPRVRKAESDQIVSALRERGVEVEYLVKEDEGHGFHNEENVFEFYRAMEAFLARHLAA